MHANITFKFKAIPLNIPSNFFEIKSLDCVGIHGICARDSNSMGYIVINEAGCVCYYVNETALRKDWLIVGDVEVNISVS